MARGLTTPPSDIGKDPGKTYQWSRDVHRAVQDLQQSVDNIKAAKPMPLDDVQLQQIRDALQSSGSHPINITGLVGRTSSPQRPLPVTAATEAALPPPSSFLPGTEAQLVAAPFDRYIVTVDGNGVHHWTKLA